MRRIAAVFSSSKRDRDKSVSSHSSAQNTARRSFTNLSLSRKRNIKASVNTADLSPNVDSTPSTPQLSTGQSSASSTGSASLQTHDETALPNPRRTKGKSWLPWLGNKSGTTERIEKRAPEMSWSLPPTPGRPQAVGGLPLGTETSSETEESDEEETEEVDEEEEEVGYSHNIPDARQVLKVLTQNGLQHQYHSSPFVQRRASPMYPRSCNPSRMLRKSCTLEIHLHKRQLLKRLQNPIAEQEAASIEPFRRKKVPVLPVAHEPVDEVAPHKADRVSGFSPGLRQWINRPPFEERLCIWLPIDETFACSPVSSAFAVAAIEFSEFIEIMADLPFASISPVLLPSPPQSAAPTEVPRLVDTTLPAVTTSSGNATSYSKSAPQIMISSPLRNDASPPPAPPRSRSENSEVPGASPTSPTKRGVRFAEDDKEDNIPIGYVMRVKKQKEEKARFLREERERRQFEEERRKHEQERLRREQERVEWEKEKAAWEKQKRAIEEERKTRLYAEEYTAARQRAEDQRYGNRASHTSATLPDRPDRNTQESRRYSRLPYDAPSSPRSQGSEPATPSPHTSSPSSSRPPSIVAPPAAKPQGHSRPASFYSNHTNSSEDVGSNGRPVRDRSHTTPARTGSTSSLLIPPAVPLLPAIFTTDMPLLPPNAPFMMMNSYSQPRSNQSRSPSSSSRQSIQRNSSSESVEMRSHSRTGSSPRSSFVSHSQTPSSSDRRPNHRRRISDDSTNRQSDNSAQPHIRSSSSHQSLPRGRSQYSTYNPPMIPNPWTAMPSRTGNIPTVMPYKTSDGRALPTRRQTTLS